MQKFKLPNKYTTEKGFKNVQKNIHSNVNTELVEIMMADERKDSFG